jgi:hypothetical protein
MSSPLLDQWINHSLEMCLTKPDFYLGSRKIFRGRRITFTGLDESLTLDDAGYTNSKLSILKGLYVNKESLDAAIILWNRLHGRKKYGSASFHTYNHYIKGPKDPTKGSPVRSVMGPCIQAVSLTHFENKTYSVDVFYRTTEFMKKFPADLILLRDTFMPNFNTKELGLEGIHCYFANITVHAQYFATLSANLDDPIHWMDQIREKDPKWFQNVIRWTSRYLCDEYSSAIEKFAQSMRIKMDVNKRLTKTNRLKMAEYCRTYHPGVGTRWAEKDDGED